MMEEVLKFSRSTAKYHVFNNEGYAGASMFGQLYIARREFKEWDKPPGEIIIQIGWNEPEAGSEEKVATAPYDIEDDDVPF